MKRNTAAVWTICLVPGFAGGAAILGAPYGAVTGFAIITSLLLCAIVAAWQIVRLQAAEIVAVMAEQRQVCDEKLHSAMKQRISGLEDFCERAVPIWTRQIETARAETEESIIVLTQRFSTILQRLSTVNTTSKRYSSGTDDKSNVINVINVSEHELKMLIDTLKTEQHTRDVAVQEIRDLLCHIEALPKMAADIDNIVTQANVLALNMAAETEDVDSSERDFYVMADEVRKFSSLTSEAGKKMSDKIMLINVAMAKIGRVAEEISIQDAQGIKNSELVVRSIIDRFGGVTTNLMELADIFKNENIGIGEEVDEILVSLQFQDRINQILVQVRESMQKMSAYLQQENDNDGVMSRHIDSTVWLDEMHGDYTTEIQRINHGCKKMNNTTDQEITFF